MDALSNLDRRRRLVARQALDRSANTVHDAVVRVAALHSSDPITPHLALWARVPGFRAEDLDAALCDDRSLWRLHAMRRTLFIVPFQEAPSLLVGATADIAAKERRRVEGWLEAELGDPSGWLDDVEARVLEAVGDGEHLTRSLGTVVPELRLEITLGSGKWSQRASIGPRVLYLMAMDGRLVRTRPAGSWRSSQYHWSAAGPWFGAAAPRPAPAQARARVVERYLATHGPATETDLRWWTGWTVARVRAALAHLAAHEVSLEDGTGWVLPDDVDPVPEVAPTAALLPGLDPTPMGFKERDWFLGDHAAALFDRNGNVGPTVWWDGRIVGGWATRGGEVVTRVLEDVGADARAAVGAEAVALSAWLDGVDVTPRFRTPLERELSG